MKMPKSFLKFLSLSITAAGLVSALAGTSAAATTDSGGRVAATVGSMKITEAQLDDKARPQLSAVQNQVYMIKKRTLDEMIDDYLIENAAKKAGVSKEAYLKKEVDDKAAAPTPQEMQDFYNKNQARIRQPFDKIKAPLEQYMKRQKVNAARAELIAQLRKQADVKVMLKAPRVEVATKNGAGAMGPSNAPITIVEFSDYQCPFCQRAEESVKEVLKKYGDKVRLVYMDFPLPMHPNAMGAAQAARCAGDQGKYWEYHDALFADQSKLDAAGLKATADKLKLDPKKFSDCTAHGLHVDQIRASQQEGSQVGVDGTPTFVINGRLMNGAQPASEIESVVDEELAQGNVKEAKAH
ncbi:MAG TPA: thioredoxin domain-containing protein [Candidatus Binataceae bacterium]|jgi:protein-disulfide isomerase|nr:thioredoxin domain-containing protein [Candidatus Binataceae bacterium]